MKQHQHNLLSDIERVKSIPIIPTMLEVICRSTGMGFAAVARVTDDRWVACSVRDEISFGLEPGGELTLETTICDEIRGSLQAVVIDHVAQDEQYRHHHTPAMYGFQSYISMPILLRTGEFFGTLCAIDPKPARLKNPETIGMFRLFAELIAFHLQSLDLMAKSNNALDQVNTQLSISKDENRQYRFISNHNLQEPLRKLGLFSSMLSMAVDQGQTDKVRDYALKIGVNARKVSMMIKNLSDFSGLDYTSESFETVDLNMVLTDVCAEMEEELKAGNVVLHIDQLPVLRAIPSQIEQLFYHLLSNAVKFSGNARPAVIHITAAAIEDNAGGAKQVAIRIADNGIGIEKSQLEKIFDIFSRVSSSHDQAVPGVGAGLAYCRKIVHNHGGTITAESEPGTGTTFSIILPLDAK